MPQVIFLSLFLGLITGRQSVDLQVDPAVASVRINLGGREAARIDKAPWSAKVDFGSALTPNELTAIAYDVGGNEVARISQLINLARPAAEVEIVIRREHGRPVEAQLVGRHRLHATLRKSKLTIDGAIIPVGRDFRARLPAIDAARPHILSAELQFEDGAIARRDVVIQAGFSGSTETQLAPMLVTTSAMTPIENLDGCFSSGGAPLRARSVDKGDAFVVAVRDLDRQGRLTDASRLPFDPGTDVRILWPVSDPINAPGEPTAVAFPQSVNHSKSQTVWWLLAQRLRTAGHLPEARQFADAVAVAAMSTLERGRRRAVILLLGKAPDQSIYTPQMVQRYLAEIGVPLFVWSAEKPRTELTAVWGPIDDISSAAGLQAAVTRLNNALAQQRIVWVAADPLTALHAEGSGRCGLIPVAHRVD